MFTRVSCANSSQVPLSDLLIAKFGDDAHWQIALEWRRGLDLL